MTTETASEMDVAGPPAVDLRLRADAGTTVHTADGPSADAGMQVSAGGGAAVHMADGRSADAGMDGLRRR
jgi:hypothetical protein